jgi:hypothetical protein
MEIAKRRSSRARRKSGSSKIRILEDSLCAIELEIYREKTDGILFATYAHINFKEFASLRKGSF